MESENEKWKQTDLISTLGVSGTEPGAARTRGTGIGKGEEKEEETGA